MTISMRVRGAGRPILLLHGGAGPFSVAAFADRLAAERPARVFTPTHPGFDGTDRPAGISTIRDLAVRYAGLLDELELDDVTVVGNSIGGWIAAELGLLHPKRVSGLVLVDAVGIEVPGQPIADFFALTFPEIARLSYADPAAAPTPPPAETMAGNRAALRAYAGEPSMADPTLRARLAGMDLPTLVVWGEADGIVSPDYGRAFAEAIPGAEFVLLPDTGHLPQLESPERLLQAFTDEPGRRRG